MICNIANAILKLFNAQCDQIPVEELDWYGNLSDSAELLADDIAVSLTTHANILASDDKTAKPGDWELSCILYGLADQARNIRAMYRIGQEAEYLARKKRHIVIELPDEYRTQLDEIATTQGINHEALATALIAGALDRNKAGGLHEHA